MRKYQRVFAALLATSAVQTSAAVVPLAEAAKLFGEREDHWGVELSPSGQKVSYMAALPGGQSALMVLDLATERSNRILASKGASETLRWCGFVSDDWLACRYGGNVRYGTLIGSFSRMIAIKTDGSAIKPLGQKESVLDAYVRQSDGNIIDWQPGADNSLLLMRTNVPEVVRGPSRLNKLSGGIGVELVNVSNLRAKQVEMPRENVAYYLSDGHGELRIMAVDQVAANYQLTGVTNFHYRAPGSQNWQPLGRYNSVDATGILPDAVDRERNAVYVFEKLNGRDAVYRMALDGSATKTLVGSNDKVDIDSLLRLGRGRAVIGYSYNSDRRHAVYFDPGYEKLANGLAKALPKTPLVQFVSSSSDGRKLLVHASADTDPGTYYILDRDTRGMRPVMVSRDLLAGRALAPVTAATYRAADGTMIPAFVTIPRDGAAPGRPAVVLPHGGPSSRDEWGFDWLAQFLAARGYAVIQPNYRGSLGYGDEFLGENAFRNWTLALSDIEDGAAYLVSQGIADPNRLAIVGWSYGGYAALQSASLHPQRYKAVVAIAPVTDLAALKADQRGFVNSSLTADFIGKGQHVRKGSPLANAARIKTPVLLVHGDMDNNVLIHHSDEMAKALRAVNTPVEYLRYKGLEHQLDDSQARIEMLTRIGEMLDRTIGR